MKAYVFCEKEDEELFRELWHLISEVGSLARKYPALYRLYLKVATYERIQKIKEKEKEAKHG
jgi:hypothetical protein